MNGNGRLEIAAGVVGVALVLFLAAFVANGWTQIKETGLYVAPKDLIDILKLVLGASLTVLYLGSVKEVKSNLIKKEDDDAEIKEDHSDNGKP